MSERDGAPDGRLAHQEKAALASVLERELDLTLSEEKTLVTPVTDLLVLTGPSASGKTAAAVRLAEHFGGALVGANSVQMYRGFDIGACKPKPGELCDVAHHLLDVREASELLDAAEFARLADAAIAEIEAA